MEGYSEAEIVAARGAASYMAFIKTPDAETIVADQEVGTEKQLAFEPGLIQQLSPGNDIVMNNPNRPNPNMDPFMRMMLREVAAGIGVSYESLSKDYSQSNYSSSRLSLLDDRDLWRMLQGWFIRSFRKELHRIWLEAAVLAGALKSVRPDMYLGNELKFEAVRFKPRGWGWIDPTKEVEAYKEAVKAGFTTVSDVIAQSAGGQDIEDVLDQRRLELDMMAEKGLEFDTDPEMASEVEPPESPEADAAEETSQPDDSEEETPLRQVVSMRAKR
jgi:lambda family phage portal protein